MISCIERRHQRPDRPITAIHLAVMRVDCGFRFRPARSIRLGNERSEAVMLIRRPPDIPSSEITPRDVYLRRREFLTGAAALGCRR